MVSLNIKNARAHEMATELARLTGESVTAAVTTAIEERLERERRLTGDVAKRLLEIGAACSARLKAPYDTIEHGELLYDERGLPA